MIDTMKWTLLLAAALFVVGCEKKESATVGGEVAAVDTTRAEKMFDTAPPEVKADLDQAIASVKSGDYTTALDKLKTLASNAKLTPEQKQAVSDLVVKVQEAVTQGASKAVDGAKNALEDVKSSLPK